MLVGAFGASAFGLRGGCSDEFISRACIACRHYAIELITYNPLTHQETRGVDASFKGLRVHSTYKGWEIGGNYVSRKEVTLLSIREPYPRPLIALSQRFRSCTGTSVLPKSLGSCTAVGFDDADNEEIMVLMKRAHG